LLFLKILKAIEKVCLLASYLLILDPVTRLASFAGTATICPVILPTKAGSEELLGIAASLAAS
jgi:hypothetical protein